LPSVKFTPHSIRTTIREYRTKGGRHQIMDALTPGLALRVGPEEAVWSLKLRIAGQERRINLGDANIVAIDEVRAKAQRAKAEAKLGGDPRLERTGKSAITLEKLIDAYLEHVKATLRQATYDDYRKVLKNNQHLNALANSPVLAIKREHINGITDKIIAEGKFPSALAFVNRMSKLWSWAVDTDKYDIVDMRIRRPSREREQSPKKLIEENNKRKARIPSPKLLHAFEEKAKTLSYVNYAAAMTTLYTAQRRNTVVQMHYEFVRILSTGWGVWHIPNAHRKSASTRKKSDAPHFVPLHPRLVDILKPLLEQQNNERGFIFPITRPRIAGQTPKSEHLNENTVTHNFQEIGAGFSPHKVRHAFSTYMETVFRHKSDVAKIILDHSEGDQGDITVDHYIVNELEVEKQQLISQWVGFISKTPDETSDLKTLQGAFQRLVSEALATRKSS